MKTTASAVQDAHVGTGAFARPAEQRETSRLQRLVMSDQAKRKRVEQAFQACVKARCPEPGFSP